MVKNLSILGSTGSIGRNVLEVVRMFPERFAVKALSAGHNIELLCEQVRSFKPDLAVVFDEKGARELRKMLPSGISVEIMFADDGYKAAAVHSSVDLVVSSMVGSAGLMPTLAALKEGKEVALANKETLVMAGDIVMGLAAEKGVSILPIDSEHSAIFQCISGQRKEDLSKILLTASGGPFLNMPKEGFEKITIKAALNHPTWQMGKKITIDSATLMNKGLEIIEARYLFGISQEKIEVLIHPQSIVHSMVSYKDGSVIAQLGLPDMKCAIAYAMSYPDRLDLQQPAPDFAGLGSLTFENPDFEKFPCLALAFAACKEGKTLPAVLNAANEIAVQAFLDERISFVKIPDIISTVMDKHKVVDNSNLSDIIQADKWAREEAARMVQGSR